MIQTPEQVRQVRAALGMSTRQLAVMLRMGAQSGRTIRRWEAGDTPISGPASVALEALLTGFRPGAIHE